MEKKSIKKTSKLIKITEREFLKVFYDQVVKNILTESKYLQTKRDISEYKRLRYEIEYYMHPGGLLTYKVLDKEKRIGYRRTNEK